MPNELPVHEENLSEFDTSSEETQDTLDEGEEEQDLSTEESNDDDDVQTDDDSDDSQSDDEEGLEFYETEEAWIKEKGLPGDFKSIDDLADAYKESVRKMNELMQNKSQEQESQSLDSLNNSKKPAQFFKTNMATNTVEEMIKNGSVSQDSIQSWKGIAKVMDDAINPFVQQVEGVLNNIASMNMSMVGELRESSWRRFQHKDLASREELDQVLKKSGDFDYNKAFKHMLVSNEDLVSKFAKKQQDRGKEKDGNKKKLPRFTSNRRSKTQKSKPGASIKQYLNPDKTLNMQKLGGLSTDMRLKVIEQYEKTYLSD